MQECRVCKETKPFTAFYKNKQYKSGYRTICKPCSNSELAAWRTIPGNVKGQKLKRYNLTLTDYTRMLDNQGGGCYICGTKPGKTMLAVDHDHACCLGQTSCGECVRGLLCGGCNAAIGLFKDDLNLMQNAIDYVKKFRG